MRPRTTRNGSKGRSSARTAKRRKKEEAKAGILETLRGWKVQVREHLGRQADDLWGVALLVLGLILLLGFFDLSGPVGGYATVSLGFLFGLWSMLVPLAVGLVAVAMIGSMPRRDYVRLSVGVGVLFLGSLAMFHLFTGSVSLAESVARVHGRGGAIGSLIAFPLRRLIGFWGAFLMLFAVIVLGALIVSRATIRDLWSTVRDGMNRLRAITKQPLDAPEIVPSLSRPVATERRLTRRTAPPKSQAVRVPEKTRPVQPPRSEIREMPSGEYALPPVELLRLSDSGGQSRRALEQTAAELEEVLKQHGVDARLTKIVSGPTVTRYEIELAPGVKVSRITTMPHDIAYALASADVRILAPIPGKSAIGIEVPNRRRSLVTLGDILSSPELIAADPMSVALGKDITGLPRMLRIDELPHLLIAGATGAGKSSCINTIVTSILMRALPSEVRIILVDPKRVELGQYNDVPHLLTRVITDPKKASEALQWSVQEMDRRYELLADAGVRDISSYREKYDGGGLDEDDYDRFPHIVIIVDELNDLMMVAGRAVEDSIVRIAQMSRAVGIHLVLATQRPSVNVITGIIKANIPARLAFSVASQTDSRVILDSAGAEKLVGLGDMLVVTAREPKPERVQGAFVTENEVKAVVDWVKRQQDVRYRDTEVFEATKRKDRIDSEFDGEDPELLRQAIDLVVRSQFGSTSMLQRKLRVGFARAGRIMDILERKGVVGPSEGSKARTVLITEEELPSLVAMAPH